MKRRYVFAILTFFATLATTAGHGLKPKKEPGSSDETMSAPMLPDQGNGAGAVPKTEPVTAGRLGTEYLSEIRNVGKTAFAVPAYPVAGSYAEKGLAHLDRIYGQAARNLRSHKVMSRAFPGRSVADVIPTDILMAIPVIEHVDPTKIRREGPETAVRDVLSRIGRRGPGAYAGTRSHAGAHGLFQYMPRTYAGIRKKYPEARLIPSFSEGMRNETNAATAVYLLLDESLAGVDKNRRATLMRSPMTLRMFLAASYNAGYPRAVRALRAGSPRGIRVAMLPGETRGYLRKLQEVHPEISG